MDVVLATGALELAGAQLLETVSASSLGRRLLLEPDHRAEDQLVPRPVEVIRPQTDLEEHPVERLLGE